MAWKMLDVETALKHGARSTDDVLSLLCEDCMYGRMGYGAKCQIQEHYKLYREHPAIQCDESFEVRCVGRF